MVWHYCSRKELSPSPWGKLYTRTTPKNGKFKDIWLLTLVFFGVDEKSSFDTNDAYVLLFSKSRPLRWHNPHFPKFHI
jgi:hypothetical protein